MAKPRPWFEISISVEADDADDAQRLWDLAIEAVCEGTGHGDDHVCRNQFASSLRPLPEDDEAA